MSNFPTIKHVALTVRDLSVSAPEVALGVHRASLADLALPASSSDSTSDLPPVPQDGERVG